MHKDTETISRQRRWQIKKQSQGLCITCGKKKAIGSKCLECGLKHQKVCRERRGQTKKKKGGAGRNPKYLED